MTEPIRLRVEFSANWNDTVYAVTMKIRGKSFTFNDRDNPDVYNAFSELFVDVPSVMEHPTDEGGIEVHKFDLVERK